ncbi:hypothetical protein EZS27_012940 [termite gut metagenome]|uniref:Endolytic murein transglycosylase n=1 Tax=termite gut metagenome TaxID=433724 RepID=A0A5J4S0U5_9ZZZZ
MNDLRIRKRIDPFLSLVKRNKKKYILLSSAVVVDILLVLGLIKGGRYYYYYLSPQFHPSQTVYIYIDRDDNIDSVYRKIEQKGLPCTMKGFRRLAKKHNYAGNIRQGRYAIEPRDNARDLFFRLARGYQTPKNLMVGSVRTAEMLARNLGRQLMIDSIEIATKLFDPLFCAETGFKVETVMCLFIPNTYQVYWTMNPGELFKRMKREYNKFWNEERLAKAKEIGLTSEEVSVLASIVGEETNNNDEKPIVAGLYLNRIKRKMLLQADPTVKFGLRDFELRRITNRHLSIKSPYNTYKHPGLPPGPIRNPSIKDIESVLNYTKHNYIYMCAKEDFSGTHNFAASLAAHNANARKYQQALNKKRIFK